MSSNIITKRPSDADIPRRVMDSIRRIVQTLRLLDRASEKKLGISGAQVFVLQKLRDGKAVSVNELAERTCTHQSAVSVVVEKLVQRDLLARERSPLDGRKVRIWITARGKAKLQSGPRVAQDRLIAAVRGLPRPLRDNLAIALERVVAETGLQRRAPTLFFEDRAKPVRVRSAQKRRKGGEVTIHA